MADENSSFLRRNWKLLVNILTLVALGVLVYFIRHELADTLANLRRVNVWVLLLLIPIEVVNYHSQVRLYHSLFQSVGHKLSYSGLLKVSLELNFVNHVFPSGGVSGISYFGLRMKSFGVSGAKSTLVQTMKLVLLFLTMAGLLFVGMFLLAAHGRASNLTMFIGTALLMLVFAGMAVFTYIIGSKTRINGFFTWLTRRLNRLIQLVRPKHPETINIGAARQAFDEFHDSYMELQRKRRELREPLGWALIANLTEILMVYVVYIAFGEWVNFGAIILAYAVANFAGLVSVLPGGVGVYEALMTAVLATAGISPAVSIPVTVMYRVLSTLIQVPPGYYLYHRVLHRDSRPSGVTDGS